MAANVQVLHVVNHHHAAHLAGKMVQNLRACRRAATRRAGVVLAVQRTELEFHGFAQRCAFVVCH